MKKAVDKWLRGEITDKQLAKKLSADDVKKLERRVFEAVARKKNATPEVSTLQ